jgi:DNA adenine methylase
MSLSRSPLCWIGGKSRLAAEIVKRIPDHESYCEVFAGAAWVFFRKEASRYEIINDINGDLVCFYRVLQCHLEEFCRQFKWCLAGREWWDDWNRQLAAGGLTDIQRAARFYYVQRHGFGGRVAGRVFGAGPRERPRINLLRLEEDLSEAHLRLARTVIEHLPYAEFLARYDRPGTFFYLDPPYHGSENFYGRGLFSREDFARLAGQLAGLQGRFILSLNDVQEVRETFQGFHLEPVKTRYSAAREKVSTAKELLIRNFDLKGR